MSADPHDGVVEFRPEAAGREVILLGRVQVGEIMRNDGLRHQACFRLALPEASASTTWRPARDVDDARLLALIKINDWLNKAGLVPAAAEPISIQELEEPL